MALFAQLGGGIYTKAADVGADLVGKVEAGIPEDDPRNAAVVADLVGDNVGDCAGRGADLFESTAAENIGAMILGVAVWRIATELGWPNPEAWIFFPLVVRAFGLLATIVGHVLRSRPRGREPDEHPEPRLLGHHAPVGRGAGLRDLADDADGRHHRRNGLPSWIWFFGAGVVGLATSVAFVYITQYYTAGSFRPVREIAEASKTGPATNIISGTAVGFETTAVTAITISIALFASYLLGEQALAGIPGVEAGIGGIFGTAVATMGMLMTDGLHPGHGHLRADHRQRRRHRRVQPCRREARARSPTASTRSATRPRRSPRATRSPRPSLAAFLLFSAYIDKVNLILERQIDSGLREAGTLLESVDLANVNVFIAALIGAMLVFFFSCLAIRAVGTAAQAIIDEVRRQFREMPGHHGRHPAARLRARRRHHHPRRAAGDDPARHGRAWPRPIIVGLLPRPRGGGRAC